MTVLHINPDPASLELHLEVAGPGPRSRRSVHDLHAGLSRLLTG